MKNKEINDLDNLLKKKKQENEALRKILEKLDENSKKTNNENGKNV